MRPDIRKLLLDKSAELFNQYGIESVSVSDIAMALKMSNGNVSYHFKKKAELLSEHIDSLETQLLGLVDVFPVVSHPKVFSAAYVDMLALTLEYRFLFVGATYILQSELIPKARYEKLISNIKATFTKKTRFLISKGYMQPIEKPFNVEILIDCMWWQWLGWMMVSQLQLKENQVTQSKQVTDAVLHNIFLGHHYMNPEFFEGVINALKKLEQKQKRVPGRSAH